MTSERIRRIVSDVLQQRAVDSGANHAKLQLDGLAPVMQLAAEAVAAGDVTTIAPYLKVLDKRDCCQTVAGASQSYDDGARKRLFDKISRVAANLGVDGRSGCDRRGWRSKGEPGAGGGKNLI